MSFAHDNPLVSFLLPCYNASQFLPDALASCLNQTYRNIEILVLLDGCTDDSAAVARQAAGTDQRVRIIERVENYGLARTLNEGIALAKGQWIARLDADDLCSPRRIELQLIACHESSEIVFVGSGMALTDERGRLLRTYTYPSGHEALLRRLEDGLAFPPHSSALINTSALRAADGYRQWITRAEDYDLWLRLAEIGKLTSIREPLVSYRSHYGQITATIESRLVQVQEGKAALIAHCLRLSGHPDPLHSDATAERFTKWLSAQAETKRTVMHEALIWDAVKLRKRPIKLLLWLMVNVRTGLYWAKKHLGDYGTWERVAIKWVNEMKA